MASLLSLLEDANLASLVLERCSPKALAALQCSSRALRALVTGQPESTWQARHAALCAPLLLHCILTYPRGWQAAAAHEYTALHPVQQVASVRAYHEQRHALLQNVLHGTPSTVFIHSLGSSVGMLSPDFTAAAQLRRVDEAVLLSIVDKASDSVLREWTLPNVPGPWSNSGDWGWTADEGHLMLPWGRGGEEGCGFVALDAQTGASTLVSLPADPDRPAVFKFWLCDASGSVAVCYLHAASGLTVSVFDRSGAQTASSPWPDCDVQCVIWGPGGKALALQSEGSLWLWDLAVSAPVRVGSRAASVLAWAAPHLGKVVFQQASLSASEASVRFASTSGHLTQACALRGLAGSIVSLAWGTRLAVLMSDDDPLWAALQVFDLQCTGAFAVANVAAWVASCACVGLALSSDGELLAAVSSVEVPDEDFAYSDEDYAHSDDESACRPSCPHTRRALQLMVMHLSSGRLNQWPLWEPLTLGGDLHLRWAMDCTAVLVTEELGHSVLFRF